jgi:hypothetical protein
MKSILFGFFGVALFMGTSCSTPVEVYQGRDDAYFQAGLTYDFQAVDIDNQTDLVPYQPHLELLQSEISRELEARGLRRSSSPDLLVNIGIVLTEEEATRETTIQEAPIYQGQRNYQWKSEEVVYDVYKQGVLVIDLIDRETSELVWKGAGTRVLPKKLDKRARLIEESVRTIFKKFPLKAS